MLMALIVFFIRQKYNFSAADYPHSNGIKKPSLGKHKVKDLFRGDEMAINKVDICGIDTSRLPVLTVEESTALMERVKAGDKAAREEFIISNLRLVLSVIQRFSGRGESMDDLFQVGCIGLIKSIDNFDTSHNVRFSTYAVPMIIGEVRRHLRDSGALRVARSMRDTAYKALQARTRLMEKCAKDPTIAEIAKEIGVNETDVVFALNAIQDPVSLFEPIYHDDGDEIYVMDQVKDDKYSDDKWLVNIALESALNSLPERERSIIELRFFDNKTQMEVASEIGISQAQVSRLEKAALLKMRKSCLQ